MEQNIYFIFIPKKMSRGKQRVSKSLLLQPCVLKKKREKSF